MRIEGPLGRLLLPVPAFFIALKVIEVSFGGVPPEDGTPEYALGLWTSLAIMIVMMWVIERTAPIEESEPTEPVKQEEPDEKGPLP